MDSLLYRGEEFDANFYYASKVDIDHSFFVVCGKERMLFVPRLNEKRARKEFDGKVAVYTKISDIAAQLGRRTYCVDGYSLPYSLFEKLSKKINLKDAAQKFQAARMKKTKEQVELIRKAVKITKSILKNLDFSEFDTEQDVRAHLLSETFERGLEPAFQPIVATGKNSSMPHYTPSNTKLKDYVLVDYGVRYKHYCADLTRCFFLKRDKKKEETDRILKQIVSEIVDELPTFNVAKELVAFSDKLFKKYKLPPQIHAIGHGIGLGVHEAPHLGKKSKDSLKDTVLAIEPGVYYKDFGARCEENVYYDGKRARRL